MTFDSDFENVRDMNDPVMFLIGVAVGAAAAIAICRINHLRETQDYVTSILIMEAEMEVMDRTIQEIQNRKN